MVVLVAVFIAAAMVTLVLSVISVHRVVVAQQAQLQTLSSLVETDIRHREVRAEQMVQLTSLAAEAERQDLPIEEREQAQSHVDDLSTAAQQNRHELHALPPQSLVQAQAQMAQESQRSFGKALDASHRSAGHDSMQWQPRLRGAHEPDSGRRLGIMLNIKDYSSADATSGCVTVDLVTAGGDVTIDMSSSTACGSFKCPPCFIVTTAHASRALILTNCNQARVTGTASFGAGAWTNAVLEISLMNGDSSQYAVIRDSTSTNFLLGPKQASVAFCYTGASGALFYQTSYFVNGLHTGYGYAEAGGGASLTQDGFLALDGIALIDGASSKHQLDGSGRYLAVTGVDEKLVITCWQNPLALQYGFCKASSSVVGIQMTSGSAAVLNTGATDYIVATKLDTLKGAVCYQDAASALHCKAGVVGTSNSLTFGTRVIVSASASTWLSLSTLGTDSAILCWKDGGNSNYGACLVISASGSTLSQGTKSAITSSAVDYTAVANVNTNKAIVCYSYTSTSNCKALTISGTSISAISSEVQITSYTTLYNSIDQISTNVGLVCFAEYTGASTQNGYCLTVDATNPSSMSVSATVKFNDFASYISVKSLDLVTQLAVVCYRDSTTGANNAAKCRQISISISVISYAVESTAGTATSGEYINVGQLKSGHGIVAFSDNGPAVIQGSLLRSDAIFAKPR